MWTHQVYCQHQLMSKPTKKSVFFRIKIERVSFFFFSFFFLPFLICLFFLFSDFCNLFFFIEENQSLFLSLSTFQVIKMGFLNEMWYKNLIRMIFGCGYFFSEKAKDLMMWLDETDRNNLLFSIFNNLDGVLHFLDGPYHFFFQDDKVILYNILLLLGALLQVGALGSSLNGL